VHQTAGAYDIAFRVEPYPKAGQPITKDNYRLMVAVSPIP
jgi:hypothetical protein